jgi:phage/plasmid primase-like uncharacterized protein
MTIASHLIAEAKGVDIRLAAERFTALRRATATEFVAACPVCRGTDRFGVNTRKQVFNCRGCEAKGDVIDLMRFAEEIGFREAVDRLTGGDMRPARPARAPGSADEVRDVERNRRLALEIWSQAESIRSSRLAQRYLIERREIDTGQIPELSTVLRFHSNCPFAGRRHEPCVVALIRNIRTDQPTGIQRTALDSQGRAIGRRGLGAKSGGAIKLWPDAEATTGLVVGEGMETVASAATRLWHRGTLLRPAWALIDRGNLAQLPVLAGVESLTILVDADQSGAGQEAAEVCADRWVTAGRETTLLTPKTLGADFNDIVRGG